MPSDAHLAQIQYAWAIPGRRKVKTNPVPLAGAAAMRVHRWITGASQGEQDQGN